ncbi:MAG TPA: hypothetical protein VFM93_11810, partial [Candidatus Limnocylindria bacterium]|nr:hypothetical protein [Candidatus Limnocylindria bacterium]
MHALAAGRPTATAGVERWPSPDLGTPLGVTRHDARADASAAILMSGRSQGLFAAVDEPRVVVVEHAEALADGGLIAEFPEDASLVMLTAERVAPARRARGRARAEAGPTDLAGAVEAAGGTIERIARLLPPEMPRWIVARAALRGVDLEPAAVAELAAAVGS